MSRHPVVATLALAVVIAGGTACAPVSVPASGGGTATTTPISSQDASVTQGERSTAAAVASANQHFQEDAFVGVIAENNSSMFPDRIQVDAADVILDMIAPLGDDCYNASDKLRALAIAAKVKMLPIGQRVLVVRANSGTNEDRAFVHLLDGDATVPTPPPPVQSVNEMLVATGFWVPDGFYLENTEPTAKIAYAIGERTWLTAVQTRYAPLILSAGNRARTARVGGQSRCLNEIEADAAAAAAASAEAEREYAKWKRDYEAWIAYRIAHPGTGYCRDGDGDGICYED